LDLSVIGNLLAVFGDISLFSLLLALGDTKFLLKLYLLTFSIGIPLAFILIPELGIIGVIIGALIDGIPSMFIAIFWAWKKYGTVIDLKSSAKILLTSLIAAMITYLFLYFLNIAYWIQLVGGLVLFCGVYLTITPLSGAITREDTNNLRNIFSSLGIISKILEIPLTLMEKISKSHTPSSNSELTQQ
jgi:O-antigen/teichoic acid export membrane protein